MAVLALAAGSLAWNQFGSIYGRDWLPYAVAIALVAAGLLWSGLAARPSRTALVALAGLSALAVWDAISLVWAPFPSLARDEALLVAFYALAFLVPQLTLRSDGDRGFATGLIALLVTALAVTAFVELLVTARPTDDYENGRLTFPISYVNAQAAVLLLGYWPTVALASDNRVRAFVRAAACGACAALLAGWLMTQSKGGLVALAVSGVVFFALTPKRLAAVFPVAASAALVGGSYELLTRPFRERMSDDFGGAVRIAAWTALAVTAAGGLLGALYVLASRHATLADRTRRLVGAALLGLLAAAIAASIAAFFIAVDHPAAYAAAKWRHFKTLPSHERGSSHLTSLGSNRYDFWRVELRLARDHPLAGVGARGFAQRYLAQRRSTETPARGHSLELDTLAETGVVGLALLVAAVGTPLALALRRGRRNAVAAGLAAAGVYGVAHASVDWVWTFPAIGVPLFLLFGIAAAGNGPARLLHGVSAAAAGLVVLLVALLAFAPPWLSSRLTTHALRHPASASGNLRWAKRLDPLAVEPWLARASLARTPAGAVEALRRAVDREPGASNLRYLLGQAYLRAGDRVRARRSLELAHRLDPRDADIVKALRRARGR